MEFDIKEWASTEKVGSAYSFMHHGKFHGILETKVGAYRGNHIHPFDQYTLLLKGKASNIITSTARGSRSPWSSVRSPS
jgi:hypothetical protein